MSKKPFWFDFKLRECQPTVKRVRIYEPRHEKTLFLNIFEYAIFLNMQKKKAEISCAVPFFRICAFVFAT